MGTEPALIVTKYDSSPGHGECEMCSQNVYANIVSITPPTWSRANRHDGLLDCIQALGSALKDLQDWRYR